MATVADILLRKGPDVVDTLTGTTVREAAAKMVEANVGSLLVEMNGKVVGIVTERDVLRRVIAGDKDADTTTVAEIMSSPVQTCTASDEAETCFDILREHAFRHLAVMDGDEPLGVISLRDVALELR